MKTLKIVLLSSLLAMSANAMTAKVNEEGSKTVYNVLKSEDKGHCVKPGLAVDLNYTSEHVDVGDASNVNIVIETGFTEGVLKVNIKSLEAKGLEFEEQNLEFQLSKDKENKFPLNLALSSTENGLYYLTLFISMEGKGGRVFEVPVKFGETVKSLKKDPIQKTESGVAITVSNAEEEIK